jgi:hypothetical protein
LGRYAWVCECLIDWLIGHKWKGICLGYLGDFVPTAEKIGNSFIIKVCLSRNVLCSCLLILRIAFLKPRSKVLMTELSSMLWANGATMYAEFVIYAMLLRREIVQFLCIMIFLISYSLLFDLIFCGVDSVVVCLWACFNRICVDSNC